MSRSKDSGTKDIDEIPLARRFKPISAVYSRRFRYVLLGSIFLTFLSIFITLGSNSIEKLSNSVRQKQLEAMISEDGLLLGHFPYPEVSKNELTSAYPGLEVDIDTFKALKQMRAAAANDGISLVLLSGYRSIDLQRKIFYENKSIRNQISPKKPSEP